MANSEPTAVFRDFRIGDRVAFPAGDSGDDAAAGEGFIYRLYPQGSTLVQLDDGEVILRQRGDLQRLELPGPDVLVRHNETGKGRALLARPDPTQGFSLIDPLSDNPVFCSGGSQPELEAALQGLGYSVDSAYLKRALAVALQMRRFAARLSSAAAAMGRRGGAARASQLSPQQRSEIARRGGLSGGRGRPSGIPR